MRILRVYRYMAHREHWCDNCLRYIMPGEFYEGKVVIDERGRLLVFKKHICPECDFPEEPDEVRLIGDNEVEESFGEVTFKIAA